jgi:hypothetical protein
MKALQRLRRLFYHPCQRFVIELPMSSLTHFVTVGKEKLPPELIATGICGGDWDLGARPIEPEFRRLSVSYRTVYQLADGVAPRETDQYAFMLARIEEGRPYKACRTTEQIDDYFERLLASMLHMAQHGYQSQQQLGGNPLDEISVVFDRHGRPLYTHLYGNHRLAMAHILGFAAVPVCVIGRHKGNS